METNLPKGWEIKKLVDRVPIIKTGVERFEGEKLYYSTGSISDNEMISKGKFTFRNRPARANRLVLEKDVVQARMRETQKAVLIDKNLKGSLLSTGFLQFRPEDNNYNSKLFYYYLRSDRFLKQRDEYATGSTQVALTDEGAKKIDLVVPPQEQQKRIADKLDVLLTKVKDSQSRLDKIPQILKRFRQAIIENVFMKTEENELVELGAVLPKGSIFDGPFGSDLKTADYTSLGVRVIRLENIGRLKFNEEKESYVSKEKYQSLIKHTVGEGDIIFASFVADEIRVCILPKLKTKAIAKADCFCIRPNKNIDPQFLTLQFASQRVYDYLRGEIHGVTRPRINTTQLKKLKVNIPEIKVQKKIVRKVKHLFGQLDQIEKHYNKVKNFTDKLEQSILAKAFRGKLVSQYPNDEPANVLLEKIKRNRKR